MIGLTFKRPYSDYVVKQHSLSELKWAYAQEIALSVTQLNQAGIPWPLAVDTWFHKALININEEAVVSNWAERLSQLGLHPTHYPELMSVHYRWTSIIDNDWMYQVQEYTKCYANQTSF